MGNDWGELERGGKPKWGLIIALLTLLVLTTAFARCSPSETRIPRSVTSPDWPLQTVSPAVQPEPLQSPRPERKPHVPTSQSLRFYVVSENVPSYWGLDKVITG